MKTQFFTPAAHAAVTRARQSFGLLVADIMLLNRALTTGGTGGEDGSTNAAESLAHDALLEILSALGPVRNKLARLANGITK